MNWMRLFVHTKLRKTFIFEKFIVVKYRHHEKYWLHNKKVSRYTERIIYPFGICYIKVGPKFCFNLKDEATLDKKHEGTLDKKHEGT